ncbi:NCS1 nucleoside transporter [Stachybotrys elegans]|uniref:NCS1 nucleoside transporter n=1 Tax=Stachybotrys elegans TaxID=80388 RepID=A0A8K0WKJ1_9HYPO|nr:NCS1 nucleoside transporter [Stachybotrys elegans]
MGILNYRFRKFATGAEETRGKDALLDNDDIRPLKLADRTWTFWTYNIFWFSATATVSNWYASSSAQALGLSIWESLGCQFGGQFLIALIITLNGRAGATYHIGYPVVCRTSFGVYGAWWPTFNRAVMAIVWNGVNLVQGGQCVYVMLHAIFPSIADIPNTMGSGSALTTAGMIGFVLFWLVNCAFLVYPVPKMRGLVYAKLVVFIISAVAMLAWVVSLAGGLGPVVHQPGFATGSERSWLIVRFLFLNAANSATFASNASDFQRYAQKNTDVLLGNLFGFPVSNCLVAIVGNLVCASSQVIFGELIWNPVTFLDRIQTADYSSRNRAGCFFIAACFAYSCLFSSIFENSLPAGNDIAALLPKYFTVRRGFFLAAVLSFAINPWFLLGSAITFISFLASYQTFLAAITGVMLTNYYIVTKGRIDIPDCFTSSKTGAYYYTRGWNIRAYVAYVVGIAPNFYGFLHNLGVAAPLGIERFYYFAYWVALFLAGGLYWASCKIWPPAIVESSWKEPKDYVRPDEENRLGGTTIESVEVAEASIGEGSTGHADEKSGGTVKI